MPSKMKTCSLILALAFAVTISVVPASADDESLETLLAYLKSPIVGTRRDAARKLGQRRVRNQVAVEALAVSARKDDDTEVRREAVEALGLIKDFSALPEMLDALTDKQADVRMFAARSLVALYTENDIAFITNRRAGWNWFNPFLDTSDREIIEAFVLVDPSIIKALGEAAANDSDRDVRIAAIRALGVLRGSEAIPRLADALNADQDVRIEVLRAFIKIGDQTAGPNLLPFFRDSNQRVRTQAMVAAGLLKYSPAVEPLLSVYGLGSEKRGTISKVTGTVKGVFSYLPPRDEAALWALSLIGDEKAEQIFVENMGDRDADRRQYAFEGLARIGESRYLDQISRLILTERNNEVKLAEHWALYKMGSRPNIQYLVRKLNTDHEGQVRPYLMEVNDPADLYPYIRSSDKVVRRKVVEILGSIGDRSTISELEPVARTSGAEMSDAATVAIKRIEWRLSGRPRVSDEVLRRETRPRHAVNP